VPLRFHTSARNRGVRVRALLAGAAGCWQREERASGHPRFGSGAAEGLADLAMQREQGDTKSLQACFGSESETAGGLDESTRCCG